MKRVRYDSEELLMVDEVADAVLTYAKALAVAGTADTIAVPTLTPTGSTETVELLISASIHLSATHVEDNEDEAHPTEIFLADLAERTSALAAS